MGTDIWRRLHLKMQVRIGSKPGIAATTNRLPLLNIYARTYGYTVFFKVAQFTVQPLIMSDNDGITPVVEGVILTGSIVSYAVNYFFHPIPRQGQLPVCHSNNNQ